MITKKLMLCCAIFIVAGPAFAQVELKAYADRDGYLECSKADLRPTGVLLTGLPTAD